MKLVFALAFLIPVANAATSDGAAEPDCASGQRYLAAAQEKGARIMTGRELAIYQAADAFELFTGLAPSTEVMGEAFDAVMAARSAAYQAA